MKNKGKQTNIKVYPFYKIVSWDLLFYYSIIFLFLTQVKGLSASQAILLDAIYAAFKLIVQIPCDILTEKYGKRKALILGNGSVAASIFILMIANQYSVIVISMFISAIGYSIKGIAETNILYDSIPDNEHRGKLFSKIDGKACSFYYYLDAITALASGFLYVINGYLPLILCFIFTVVSTALSIKFKETEDLSKKKKIERHPLKQIKYAFRDIAKSPRLKRLVLFYALVSALLTAITSLRSSILKDLALPEQYFGVIFAILQVISGIGSKNQERMHKRLKNKTLAYIALPLSVSCIVIGFVANGILPVKIALAVIMIAYMIQYIGKGMYYVLITRYLNNFTNMTMRVKIGTMRLMLQGIFSTGASLFASFLLGVTNTANAFILVGCLFTLVLVLLLDNMRDKVGLKPEEYPKEDIQFVEIN